ncbi:APC family permease [Arthrobacter mobilis]|uniref:Amino acid permease n=1 Tax=Arthrobacter mobilis TaxID=2724944 RepID=A0A7X6HBB8_9MICC|nr:amino acid permease [Arthrobacter mobilis]NKX53013.1 amino acid permease [Arthrobacter mobilis]
MSLNPTPAGTTGPAPAAAASQPPQLKRVLGLWVLVLFGLTYMAPVTVFTTYGLVTDMTGGHLAAAYVVALATMIFTAVSYARMSQAVPAAGSAYSYTQQTFGGHVGFMTGWTLMLDYLFLPMINFLLIGIYMNTQFPSVPAWVFSLAGLLLVLVMNALGINFVGKFSGAIVAVSMVLIVVFVALSVNQLASAGAPSLLEPFSFADGYGPIFAGAAVLALSFLGFDAVSTLAEDAKDARRNVPRAIVLATVFGGLIFILVAWVGALVFPDWQNFTNLDSAGVELMAHVGGTLLTSLFVAIYVAGCIGSGMTSQVSVTRIIYAMGRDGLLPQIFGRLHPKFGTPMAAALAVSAISLLCLVMTLETAASMISFGALFAFSMVNLSVVKHFVVDQRRRSGADLVKFLLLPLVGFGLTIWLWTSLAPSSFTVGLVWMAAGLLFLAFRTKGFRKAPPKLTFSEA